MEKIAEYYLGRFKSVVADTNKLALLFLFTLLYVWHKSVNPTFGFLKNIATSKEQCIYFDSVYSPLNKNFNFKLKTLYDKGRKDVDKFYDSVTGIQNAMRYESVEKDFYLNNDSNLIKSFNKRRNVYNTSILPIKRFRDSITNKLQDSLNKYQFKIEIPTLSNIEVDINIGIPIWMFLVTFFISLMYFRRNRAFRYLQKSLTLLFNDKENIGQLDHLDASIPFWMQPLKIDTKQYSGKKLNIILENTKPLLNNFFLMALILLLVIIQYRTLTIIWNKHYFWEQYQLFQPAYLSKAICFLMMAVSVVISILWFIPQKIDLKNHIAPSSSRRKFIALGIIIFAAQFIKPGYLLSAIKPNSFNYRRKRPVKPEKNLILALNGFYINKRIKYKTIHYFDESGRNPMLKTVPSKKRDNFINNLKPIDIFEYFNLVKNGQVNFPRSVWCIENSSEQLIKNGNFSQAFKLLKQGIELNFYSKSRERLIAFFKKKQLENNAYLSNKEKKELNKFIISTKKKAEKLNKFINLSK